jgi:hypothetical protein
MKDAAAMTSAYADLKVMSGKSKHAASASLHSTNRIIANAAVF